MALEGPDRTMPHLSLGRREQRVKLQVSPRARRKVNNNIHLEAVDPTFMIIITMVRHTKVEFLLARQRRELGESLQAEGCRLINIVTSITTPPYRPRFKVPVRVLVRVRTG